jgi:hypothetical protein
MGRVATRGVVTHHMRVLGTQGIEVNGQVLSSGADGAQGPRAVTCFPGVLLPAAWLINRLVCTGTASHRQRTSGSIMSVRRNKADDLAFGTVESWIAYVSLKLFFTPLSQLTV